MEKEVETLISKELVKFALEDPTGGATGDYADGYRDALKQVKRDLGLE